MDLIMLLKNCRPLLQSWNFVVVFSVLQLHMAIFLPIDDKTAVNSLFYNGDSAGKKEADEQRLERKLNNHINQNRRWKCKRSAMRIARNSWPVCPLTRTEETSMPKDMNRLCWSTSFDGWFVCHLGETTSSWRPFLTEGLGVTLGKDDSPSYVTNFYLQWLLVYEKFFLFCWWFWCFYVAFYVN